MTRAHRAAATAAGRSRTTVSRVREAPDVVLALGVALVALALRLPLIASASSVAWAGDTAEYLMFADELQRGRFPTTYRVPGYSALMAVLEPLPGSTSAAVVIVQHLLGVGVCALVVIAGCRFFGRTVGVMSGLLAALTPVMLGLEHTLQPDFLFGALVLVGALGLASVARGDAGSRVAILTGLAFAAATYVKPVGQVLAGAAVVAVLLGTRSLRTSVRPAAIVVVAMVVALAPWVARNAALYGRASVSDQGGQTLFKRLFDIDRRPIPTDTAEGRLVSRLAVVSRRVEPRSDLNNYVSRALQARGRTAAEAVAIEGRVARQAIEADPLGYAVRTVPRLAKSLTDINSFSSSDLGSTENSSSLRPGTGSVVGLAILAWYWPVRLAAWIWWVVSLAALSSVALLWTRRPEKRAAIAALLAVWLSVALATALSHGGMRRYSAELAPLVWLFASAGAVWLSNAVTARLPPRRRRAEAGTD